jgi:hypothetical protein
MKKLSLLLLTLALGLIQAKAADVHVSHITSNTTWVSTNVYFLDSTIFVTNNATLTIKPGTIIKGVKGTVRPCLVITRGAKLMAEGTADNPIIFTSNQAPGSRNAGDWGGIIICGKAKLNQAAGWANVEGFPTSASTTESEISYGGTDDADNSGSLKYVRIEFPGIAFATNQEINGLTMGSVGSGTTIENIQISYSGDDSYEWFGGTVNCKRIIALHGVDDDFDADNGYSGKVQFGVCFRHPNIADISQSNGIETDNNATGTYLNPRTSATFSNFTLVGPRRELGDAINTLYRRGAHIRRASTLSVFNSITMGWPQGLNIDGTATKNAAANDTLLYLNNVIAGCNTALLTQSGGSIDSINPTTGINAWYANKALGSIVLDSSYKVGLTNPFDTTSSVSAMPISTSPMLTGASFSNARLAGFENVPFRGAFGATNWAAGWSSFSPRTNVYVEQTPPNISWSALAETVLESAGKKTVMVKCNNSNRGTTNVVISSSGTASNGGDFSLSRTSFVFPANDSTEKPLDINIVSDNFVETNETVVLRFTSYDNNGIVIADSVYTLTIQNDDTLVRPTPTISFVTPVTATVNEKGGTYTAKIRLTNTSPLFATTVNISTAGTMTAGEFTVSPTTINFPAGDSVDKDIVITIIDDTLVESNETIELSFVTNSDYNVGTEPKFTLTVANDDTAKTTGIINSKELEFNVYPIPVSTKLYIDVEKTNLKSCLVTIFNLTGVKVYESNINNSNEPIDMSAIPNGQYMIQLNSDKINLTKKILVSH